MPLFDKKDTLGTAVRNPLERLPTEAGEALDLGYENVLRTSRTDSIEIGLKEEYQTILDEIEKRTGQRLINPVNYVGYQDTPTYAEGKVGVQPARRNMYGAQIGVINEFINRNQEALSGMPPINEAEIKKKAVEKALRARNEWSLASEYAGTGASVAGFVGGMGAGVTDPPNVAATIIGLWAPPSRGLPLVMREAGINMAAEVVSEPSKRDVATTLGFKRNLGDLATDVGMAGVFGAGFSAGAEGVARTFEFLRRSKNPMARAQGIVSERAHETVVQDNPSAKIAAAESADNLAAENPNSTATGKFQFTEGTWNEFAKETGVPPIIEGKPDPRLNESYQDLQEGAYRKRSVKSLEQAGLAVDDTNLYLSHFLGQQGAVDFLKKLKADPTAPAVKYVDHAAVDANRKVFFKKNGMARTAQELYQWAAGKMGSSSTGLPEAHIANYDANLKAMNEGGQIPEPQPVPGAIRPPHQDGLELVDPNSVQVDAKTFQFKEGGDQFGVTDRLTGVDKWEPDFAGVALVYERADGSRFIADGHQRLALAKRTGGELNARILREADGWTPEAVRVRAAVKNIAEGTGSPLDAAKIMRAARASDLPPLPPTSALARQGRALAELSDDAFGMVVNGVVPENYGALVGRLIKDPKMQEAAIRVLNKTRPENVTQAETIIRQVSDTEMTTTTQSSLFGEEHISESLFLERAKVMDASIKALKKDKAVFSTLVNQAERIEGAGNKLSREMNLERMNQDAKVADYIQKLASRKGPISDALTDAARKLKEGARPGDATRDFLRTVRGSIDSGLDGGSGGRISGSVVDSNRDLQPAEIKTQQEFLESQPADFLDHQISTQVDEALSNGVLSKDMEMDIDVGGTMVKKKIGSLLDDLAADEVLVRELTACVEGAAKGAV